MGSLLTVDGGTEITEIANGAVFLNFMDGTITLPEGSTAPLVRNMNKNLNDLGLQQCNSIAIWMSDADATYQIGSAVSLSDHQLSHVINNYGFNSVRIDIPTNSTPDATNQLFFMASTDGWLGYSFPRISHQRGQVPIDTTTVEASTNSNVVYLSKHVGAYNQFLITTSNEDSSNSLDVTIEFSENGEDWFQDSGYTSPVAVAAGSFNAYASEIEHHFVRVQCKSTSSGQSADFKIFYNFVNDRGSAFL